MISQSPVSSEPEVDLDICGYDFVRLAPDDSEGGSSASVVDLVSFVWSLAVRTAHNLPLRTNFDANLELDWTIC
jgi:hypothetical protein